MTRKNNNKILGKHVSSVAALINRHRILFCIVGAILLIYFIIRIFFTPALLDDVHFSRAYYDRNENLMRITLTADEKYRLFTPLKEISPYVQQATILYEDKYFYYHPGINPISLFTATKNYLRGDKRPAGASTITMQVARIKYDLDTRRPGGKLKQIAAALYINAFYSKHEILEAYLNLAPYGGNIESIGAASVIYFNKNASDLGKVEAITLATIPQNPTKRGLNTTTGINNIMNMRGDLVRRWIARFPGDEKLATLADMPLAVRSLRDLPFDAPHFINSLISRQNNYWSDIGPRPSQIKTTINMDLQRRLEKSLRNEISRRKSHGITNAAAILVNYKTMDTVAYIGSVDYFDKSIYGENDGVRARRSPGSTLKPLIYASAVDRGYIHGMTLLKDAKINFGVYAPENADNEFYGPVLARDALTHSRNIPAINLVKQIGIGNFYKLLNDIGVENLRSPDYYGISIALGGAEVSMWELAQIYATMANLGMHYNIRTQLDQSRDTGTQLLSPEAFFITLDMLGHQATPQRNTPFARAQHSNINHYWKTGTSSSFRDAWTAGIFGDYVLIVWVGNFDGRPNNAFSGAKTAAPIYFSLASVVSEYDAAQGRPVVNNNFMRNDLNISQIEMCDGVGGLAGKHCPKVVKSYFIPGKSPIETSSVYRAVPIDRKTGLRACSQNPETTYMAVYEFWDAEYLDMFRRAGITRKTPPPFMPGCSLDNVVATRSTPVIMTPIDGTKIVIVSDGDSEPVSFQAITDLYDTKIFWFLDGDMIGTTTTGQVMRHNVPMGEHTVRIVDEMGAAKSANFIVVK